MHQRFFFTAATLLLLLLAPEAAQAQTGEHKYEAGVIFTALGAESAGEASKGVGARFGYNFNEHFALDAETAFFPRRHLGNDQTGQNVQGFVGLKAGTRSKYAGIFAKARPGVMFVGDSVSGFDCDRRSNFTVCRPEHNHLALDAGLVAEVYPTSRAIIRLDVGDTIVRFRNVRRDIFTDAEASSTHISHNLQISIGFGYRF